MSDIAQGPDWWLASDGKWYPPSSGGSALYAPPRPVVPPQVMSPVLAVWTQGLLWIAAAVSALAGVLALLAMARFNTYWEAPFGLDDAEWEAWAAMDDAYVSVGLAMLALMVPIAILLMVWMNRAHKVSHYMNPQPRSWTSGWTVGGWFIPFANWVIPRLVIGEIERIATAARTPDADPAHWRRQKTMAVGWVWWISLVVATVLATVGTSMFQADADLVDPSAIRNTYVAYAISDTLTAVAGAAGALYIRALTRLLT